MNEEFVNLDETINLFDKNEATDKVEEAEEEK